MTRLTASALALLFIVAVPLRTPTGASAAPSVSARAGTPAADEVVVFASSAGAALNSDINFGGGTDDTAALQAVLDAAPAVGRLHLVINGVALVTGLNVRSDTTISSIGGGGLYLKSGSNRAVIRNAVRTAGARLDHGITLRDITINGNREGQSKLEPGGPAEPQRWHGIPVGTWVSGLQFYGVSDLTLSNVNVMNTRNYGVHIANAARVRLSDVWASQPDWEIDNHAGIQFDGNTSDVVMNNIRVTNTTDDGIALNADDDPVLGPFVANGPITNVSINGLFLDNAFFGVRLMSNTSRLDGISIQNVSGTLQEYVALFDDRSYFFGGGSGNIGRVSIDGVNVTAFSVFPQGDFEPIRVEAHVDQLSVKNFRQGAGWYSDYRPIIRVTAFQPNNGQPFGYRGHGYVENLDAELSIYDPPGTNTGGGGSPKAGSRIVVEGGVGCLNLAIQHDRDTRVARNFGAVRVAAPNAEGGIHGLNMTGAVNRQTNTISVTGGRLDNVRIDGFADWNNLGSTLYVQSAESAVQPIRLIAGSVSRNVGTLVGGFNASGVTRISAFAAPIDEPDFFVSQHYQDFLGRQPDPPGLDFWGRQIKGCACAEVRYINVSASFFLSIEFQETGYLVYRLYQESYGRQPRYGEFIPDVQEMGRGVVVGQGDWQGRLAANRQAFADAWVQRPAFKNAFDGLSNADYVNRLYANAGVAPPPAERDALVGALDSGAKNRARVLLDAADSAAFRRAEFNRAFVLMQYFGYLRRDPDADGYNFWLSKLDQSGGDFVKAEMVKAFLNSFEYRQRFR